jgi:5'-methylthioadenosine phosphorylase
MAVAIIAGTGADQLLEGEGRLRRVETPYGWASVRLLPLGRGEVVFLPRHGEGHAVPPHRINYRANIRALGELGVTAILASHAVGSLRPDLPPGRFVLPDQLLELTKTRPSTFYDGEERSVVHTDFTHPFCRRLRQMVLRVAEAHAISVYDGATYLCLEGPRFETAAEIRLFAQWGADLVGMTAYPEAILARELGICYASVSTVTNLAAGLTARPVDHEAVEAQMAEQGPPLRDLLFTAAQTELKEFAGCDCSRR